VRTQNFLGAEGDMRRVVSIRIMAAMLLALAAAGISGCAGSGGPAASDDRPGGGFAGTGRGFTYGI
jgi:hypothetical protein